jgi:hypothetical protein
MKFLCISLIILISCFSSLKLRERETNYVFKMTENYLQKIGHKNVDEFKNMIFRELDQKTAVWDNNMKSIKSLIPNNRTNNDLKSKIMSTSAIKNDEGLRNFAGEYISSNRVIKFYVSLKQECSLFINDTVYYENLNNVNFVEHMILHNNAEAIDPKGVYSDDININFFLFNRKLNIFSVYFDPKKQMNNITHNNVTLPLKNFSIEYDYDALNIIKSNFVKENTNNIENSTASYNSFIWKILNQNFLKSKENISIEIYFDLGKDFMHEDVEFSLNFTKSIIDDDKKNIVKYKWHGTIDPQEVIVLQAKFPLYFEHCGNLSINLVMIFVGAVFIIFLIGMLYIILSTVFSDDLF